MTRSGAVAELRLDDQGRIDEDVECRSCAYNLRGLTPEGRCPECRQPVAFTTRSDLLRFQDTAWLRRIALGTLLLLWVTLAYGVEYVVNRVVGFDLPGEFTIPAALIGARLAAVWLITTPEPDRRSGARDSRTIARWGLVVSSVVMIALLCLFAQRGQSLRFHLTVYFASAPFAFIEVGALLALGLHGRRLAARMPDTNLAHQAAIVAWGLVAPLAVFRLVFLARTVAYWKLGTAGSSCLFEALSWTCRLAQAIFVIWVLILLVKYRRRLEAAVRESAGWSPPDTMPG